MRRGRIIIYLALILIFAVLGAVLLLPKILPTTPPVSTPGPGGEPAPTAAPVNEINVVFVAQKIPRGTTIGIEYLTYVPYPQELVVEGMFTDFDEVEGKIAKYDLEPNVPLTSGMIAEGEPTSEGSDAALFIDKGKVAISIPISRLSSVSRGIQRGDHVNVIATILLVDLDQEFQTALPNNTGAVVAPGPAVLLGLGQGSRAAQESGGTSQEANISASLTVAEQLRTITAQVASGGVASAYGRAFTDPNLEQTFFLVPSEAQRPRMVSQTILQDIRVLQVGDFDNSTAAIVVATEEPVLPGQEQPVVVELPPDVITLIVTPQEAVTLNYLLYSGAELTLVLRSANDDSRNQTEAVTLKFLLEEYKILVPEKETYGQANRIDELIAPSLPNDNIQSTPAP